jgi:MoaA/NifB/PqqE/SkfB family radical SAM enzyme
MDTQNEQAPIRTETPNESEQRFLKLLRRNGAPFDYERQLFNDHYQNVLGVRKGDRPIPYELEIQPTSICNLKCEHCFGKALTCSRLEDKMDMPELEKIAQRISEFHEGAYTVETVKFCGTTGEPLVNPITIPGINLFKKIDKKVILYTNGLWLDKKTNQGITYAEAITQADKVNISLDAGTPQTFFEIKKVDGFNRTIKNIENLVASRNTHHSPLRIDVSYVIGPKNYLEVETTVNLIRQLGADHLIFRVDFAHPNLIKSLAPIILAEKARAIKSLSPDFKISFAYSDSEILDTDKDQEAHALTAQGKKCYNHNFWACIGPDCNLYVCGHRTYEGVEHFGNVLDTPLNELWNSKKRTNIVDNLPDDKCKFCSPSCHRRDCLMKDLSERSIEEIEQLHEKYVVKKTK